MMDRQRILILFGVAWVSAALLSWFLYQSTVVPKQEKRTSILAAVRDLQPGMLLKKADVKLVAVLPRDLPKGAVLTDKDALNHVVLYPLAANQPLVGSAISTTTSAEGIPATIEQGYRAVSVSITDTSGVAGLIAPNSHVDVLFTRPGSMSEAITSTILQNVKVLAVGHAIQTGQLADPKAPKLPVVTLVVTPEDAQKLELAKNEGRISLSLRNPLDAAAAVDGEPVSADVLDPAIKNAKLLREMKSSGGKLWSELNEKPKEEKPAPPPPEPPRAVIDVFRGDKHVQEVFRK